MGKSNDTAELTAMLAMHGGPRDKRPLVIASDAVHLERFARGLHRLAEEACNRDLTAREEKRITRLRRNVEEVVRGYRKLAVVFNTDPRGPAVKLRFDSGHANGWEAGMWGV